MPEALFGFLVPAVLGWAGFTWRRAEMALDKAERVADKVDRVELKMAEEYLTKKDFETTMERLFKGFERIEEKIDFHVYEQDRSIKALKSRLRDRGDDIV